jgi:hypothetical protein
MDETLPFLLLVGLRSDKGTFLGAQTAIWSLKSSQVPSTQKIFSSFFSIAIPIVLTLALNRTA